MLFPERIAPGLLHIGTNFQATSAAERAFDILQAGGVLSIKAHIAKSVPGHLHLDGVDELYMITSTACFSRSSNALQRRSTGPH